MSDKYSFFSLFLPFSRLVSFLFFSFFSYGHPTAYALLVIYWRCGLVSLEGGLFIPFNVFKSSGRARSWGANEDEGWVVYGKEFEVVGIYGLGTDR